MVPIASFRRGPVSYIHLIFASYTHPLTTSIILP